MKILKFGAIDVGSNAIRLLVSSVIDENVPFFKKSSLIRIPLRLGFDAFENGKISKATEERFLEGMIAYKHLLKAHNVVAYRAYATSAMREASNGKDIVKKIKKVSGIDLEIIDGQKEAEILYSADIMKFLNKAKNYLYVDVGGGSTEISLFSNGKIMASKSFKIGTIRLLKKRVSKKQWQEMEDWVKKTTKKTRTVTTIGTGGNINKIFKLTGKITGQPVSFNTISAIDKKLRSLSIEQRMRQLNMNPDRADVVVHASRIFTTVMGIAKSKKIVVPKQGLADGLILQLYKDYSRKK